MKSRNSTPIIRGPGQRSISSTSLFRPLPKSNNYTSDKEGSNVSLTSFLNRNLHATSVLPLDKVKEERYVDNNLPNKSIRREDKHGCDALSKEGTCVIEESVFKLFNSSEVKSKKRSSEETSKLEPDVKNNRQNHLVVLGDDPKPKKRPFRQVSCSDKIPKFLYNHYENGTGWWDSEREGIDNEEVGSKEIWEGVGSTTLGGLDWH